MTETQRSDFLTVESKSTGRQKGAKRAKKVPVSICWSYCIADQHDDSHAVAVSGWVREWGKEERGHSTRFSARPPLSWRHMNCRKLKPCQMHRRSLARLPIRCRPSKSPRTSLFLQRLPHPASGPSLHCWQPNIFGCWPSGVELPATGGYVGTVSGDLPHSTQDISVYWIVSWTFGWSDILCPHIVCSGPSTVLNT